ncbi:MAG: hypothetical protein ACLQUY_23055 [Ktedonobacterales bacterium]
MSPILTVIVAFGLLFVMSSTLGLGLRLNAHQVILSEFRTNWKLPVGMLLGNFVVFPVLMIGLAALVPIPSAYPR